MLAELGVGLVVLVDEAPDRVVLDAATEIWTLGDSHAQACAEAHPDVVGRIRVVDWTLPDPADLGLRAVARSE